MQLLFVETSPAHVSSVNFIYRITSSATSLLWLHSEMQCHVIITQSTETHSEIQFRLRKSLTRSMQSGGWLLRGRVADRPTAFKKNKSAPTRTDVNFEVMRKRRSGWLKNWGRNWMQSVWGRAGASVRREKVLLFTLYGRRMAVHYGIKRC